MPAGGGPGPPARGGAAPGASRPGAALGGQAPRLRVRPGLAGMFHCLSGAGWVSSGVLLLRGKALHAGLKARRNKPQESVEVLLQRLFWMGGLCSLAKRLKIILKKKKN